MSLAGGPEDYQKLFNTKAYLEMYYKLTGDGIADVYLPFLLKNLASIFNSGMVKGRTLIEIGSGPSIHSLLSACEVFEEIIVTDFTDRNREAFKDWLLDRPGAFDWSSVVKLVCHLEGDRRNPKEKEARLKKAIKQVLKCDILKCPPLEDTVPQADCLLSSFCLESACKDQEDYRNAVRHITPLLKPGGYLVLIGSFGSTFYMVGDVKFFGLTLTEAFVRETLAGEGFTIENLEVSNTMTDPLKDVSHFSAFYVLVARKK